LEYVNAALLGIALGSVYGLIGLGYTVVFNATRIVNLVQGDLVMVGVLLSYMFLVVLHWPQWAAAIVVILAVVLLSLAEERLVIRPFLGRATGTNATLGWLVATLGCALVIETVATLIWGQRPVAPVPSFVSAGTLRIGGVYLQWYLLVPIVTLALATAFLYAFYNRTRFGRAMRATADDSQLAALRGVNPRVISRGAMAIGGLLAGVTGFAVAPVLSADPSIGLEYGLTAFCALAIGGFGSITGTLLGAWVLGIAQQLLFTQIPGLFQNTITLGVLAIVLLTRPSGLLVGTRERRV
jgi:branched-chain amino acid transport system permease protein